MPVLQVNSVVTYKWSLYINKQINSKNNSCTFTWHTSLNIKSKKCLHLVRPPYVILNKASDKKKAMEIFGGLRCWNFLIIEWWTGDTIRFIISVLLQNTFVFCFDLFWFFSSQICRNSCSFHPHAERKPCWNIYIRWACVVELLS